MGDLAKTIFSLLLGWLPTVAYTIWNGINNHDGNSFFSWIGAVYGKEKKPQYHHLYSRSCRDYVHGSSHIRVS